jgi:hypothetical protein
MEIERYLRVRIVQKFNPLAIKETCEYCGKNQDLEVHHTYRFKDMLIDTLKELNIEYKKDTDEYSELDILNIVEKILGKHLYYNYKTVCYNCHMKITKEQLRTDKRRSDRLYSDEIKDLSKIINECLGVECSKKELEDKIIKKFNLWEANRGRFVTVNKLIGILEDSGYKVIKKVGRREGKKMTLYRIVKGDI